MRKHERLIDQPLTKLSAVELILAAERHYRKRDLRFADGLLHAAEIVAEGGWKHIAPALAEEVKKGVR